MWSYTPPKWYTRRSPLHTSKRSQRTLPHFLHNRTTIHLLAQTLIYYPVFKHATIHPSQSLDFHYIRIHFPDMKFLNFQHSNKYTRVVNMPSYKTTPSISWVFNALRAVFQLTTLLWLCEQDSHQPHQHREWLIKSCQNGCSYIFLFEGMFLYISWS